MKDCTGDLRDAAVQTARREFVELVEAVRGGAYEPPFPWALFDDFRYTAEQARELIRASIEASDGESVSLHGSIIGDVDVTEDDSLTAFSVAAHVQGSLRLSGGLEWILLSGRVDGSVAVIRPAGTPADGGNLWVVGDGIGGRLEVCGAGAIGSVLLEAEVGGDLALGDQVTVGRLAVSKRIGGRIWIGGDASISTQMVLQGEVGRETVIRDRAGIAGTAIFDLRSEGGIRFEGDATVSADVMITGSVADVRIEDGASLRSVVVEGAIRDALWVTDRSTVAGPLRVEPGAIIGLGVSLDEAAQVTGDLLVQGTVGVLVLEGTVGGSAHLSPRAHEGIAAVELASVRGARFDRTVHLGDNVSIASCDLRQCGDLDKLDLVGADLFTLPDGSRARALANPPSGTDERVPDGEMASIYRQLRVNLEGKGNRPASAFFYRGEMDSRRRAALADRRWAEWGWLSLYRIVAGYGLKVAPPLLWFLAAWMGATAVFLGRGLVVLHGGELVSASWWQAAAFTLQSMLSVFRPPDALLGLGTTIVQVVLRIVGPILLGLAALAVRDKVAR